MNMNKAAKKNPFAAKKKQNCLQQLDTYTSPPPELCGRNENNSLALLPEGSAQTHSAFKERRMSVRRGKEEDDLDSRNLLSSKNIDQSGETART